MLIEAVETLAQLNAEQLLAVGISTGMLTTVAVTFTLTLTARFRAKMSTKLSKAQMDILFLLEVEREYGLLLSELTGSTQKIKIRKQVSSFTDCKWSGENTASRIAPAKTQCTSLKSPEKLLPN